MNNTTIERELTFLVKDLPLETAGVTPIIMEDAYFPDDADHAQLRARRKGSAYEITKKQPVVDLDVSIQTEQSIPLTETEFVNLTRLNHKKVTKLRYVVEINGYAAEVDVFQGDLAGLVLIDFEFDSEEAMQLFVVPDICLANVTQEEFIAGGYLSGKAYADIAARLAEYQYVAILHNLTK